MVFDHAGKKLDTPITNQEIDAFINRFKHEHESWQVKQARYAISLYHHFLSNNTIQNDNLSLSYDQKWAVLADRMKNCMRLQHKAYKTEQAYMAWLRNFYSYTKGKPPEALYTICKRQNPPFTNRRSMRIGPVPSPHSDVWNRSSGNKLYSRGLQSPVCLLKQKW